MRRSNRYSAVPNKGRTRAGGLIPAPGGYNGFPDPTFDLAGLRALDKVAPKRQKCVVKEAVREWLQYDLPGDLARKLVITPDTLGMTVWALGRAYDGGSKNHRIGRVELGADRATVYCEYLGTTGGSEFANPRFFEQVETALHALYAAWVREKDEEARRR